MEEWKKIKNFENYSVSKDGEVRNDKTGKILKKCKEKGGYERVTLYKNGKTKKISVHRLVAEAFIPNSENKPCVDHIIPISNGGSNCIENLRWCTHKENSNNPLTRINNSESKKGKNHADVSGENNPMYGKQHSEETRRKISENHADFSGENHPRCRKIICITTGEIFDYIRQAEEKYKVNHTTISFCCKGKSKSAGKHPKTGEKLIWMYLEDYLKGEKNND